MMSWGEEVNVCLVAGDCCCSAAAWGICGLLTVAWYGLDRMEAQKRAAVKYPDNKVGEDAPWR